MKLYVRLAATIGFAAIFATSPTIAACPGPVPKGFKCRAKDVLVHQASGTRFPEKLAGFTRVYEEPLDDDGYNAVIAYRLEIETRPVVVRIALIHIEEMTPKEHYIFMKASVGDYFRSIKVDGVKEAGEGPFDPPGMKRGSGYQGRFSGRVGEVPYELSLSTVSYGYWSARLSAAYPAEGAPISRAAVLELAKNLQKGGLPKPGKRRR